MAGTSWRLFGSRRAAETLLEAMSGDDEQNRMIAGMSLVRAGQKSFDLIEETIDAGDATPEIVRLLPDIGGEESRDVLSRLASGDSPELRQAAKDCIDLLDRIEAL